MKKKLLILFFFSSLLFAKELTTNDVYFKTVLIQKHLDFILNNFSIQDQKLKQRILHIAKLKPRDSWQKSYELLVKINRLRLSHDFLRIQPIGMEPVENLSIPMLYGMVDRVLAEIIIFEHLKGISVPIFRLDKYTQKNLLDIYNALSFASLKFDELNGISIGYSYIYAETMRVYDDLTMMLNFLHIKDETIPNIRMKKATTQDAITSSLKLLKQIIKLQHFLGIDSIEYAEFTKLGDTTENLYSIVGLIVAEIQPLKAYLGLIKNVTPPALSYEAKTPAEIVQLMGWNLKKFQLIENENRR